MNIYQAIRLAAKHRWKIFFTDTNTVLIAKNGGQPPFVIGRCRYDSPNGIVNPVTALIRAVTEAKNNRAEEPR